MSHDYSTPQEPFISRCDLDRLLSSLLALDRAVVELYMQVYETPPDQQLVMRRQNQTLHILVWESYSGQANRTTRCIPQ
jgi:hypothetical protein